LDVFGSFALVLALLAAAYAIVCGILAIRTRNPLLTKSARHAGMAVFLLVSLAVLSVEYLFFTNNFSMAYVAEHSNRDLPGFYKFAALWSGQEGSMLFWSWLLSGYAFFALFLNRKKHPELMPYVGVVIACVQLFFLILNNFVASPFQVLGHASAGGGVNVVMQADGQGLNPLLQYYEMVIHPPMLYLGYTGFTIPFAFAMAALLGRYPGEKWIHVARRWTMIAWCFQTIGILLGAHWAYAVLGWGGYWAWDPDGFFALGDDAGKARHDEGVEYLAGVRHFHAVHFGDDADQIWSGKFGARVRSIVDRDMVRGVSGHCVCGLRGGVLD
jgi:cytochrome c-type biogenesis protein CcmF